MKRREFMLAASGVAGGAAVTAGATGPVAAAEEEESEDGHEGGGEGGGEPDYGGWLSDANGYDGTEDLRGEDEVTVEVGAGDGFAFAPAAIWIDPGTTVVWEWTGEGGAHNVNAQEGEDVESELISDAGATFEHTFEEDGTITTYQCDPHAGEGMKGAVAVGDVETVSAGGAEALDPHELGVDIHEHWVGVSVMLMLVVSLVYTFFVLKYGESPHTSGRNG